MLSYYPHSYVISTTGENVANSHLKNDKNRVLSKSAYTSTRTSKRASNSIAHNGVVRTTNHMNGHATSARNPVLGSDHQIAGEEDQTMAPTSDPKSKTKVKFSGHQTRGSTVQNSEDGDPLRNHPQRSGETYTYIHRFTSRPTTLLRTQSTQTDPFDIPQETVHHLKGASSTPNLAPAASCSHDEEELVLRPRKSFGSVSWSARYPETSILEQPEPGPGSRTDSDSSLSAVAPATNPAEELPLSVILVGDSGTGKTCLVARLAENIFVQNYDVTVGIDFNIARIKLPDGRPVRLQLWDTAGQEKYRAITSSYYRKAMGVVLVYDVTRRESLDSILEVWRGEVDKFAESDVVLMLLGNKMDLDDYRTVTTRVGVKVAAQLKATFFEVSAKEDLNIQTAFVDFAQTIVDDVYNRRNPCLSSNAIHIDHSNHDRDEKKLGGPCSCR